MRVPGEEPAAVDNELGLEDDEGREDKVDDDKAERLPGAAMGGPCLLRGSDWERRAALAEARAS